MTTVLATRGDGAVIIYDQDDKYGQAWGHIRKGEKTYSQRPVIALLAHGRWTLTETQPVTAAIVRTPAGAKKYGQPIGSVIVRDVVPHLPGLPKSTPLPPEVTKTPKAKIPEQIIARDLKPGDVYLRQHDQALVKILTVDHNDYEYAEAHTLVLTGPTAGIVGAFSLKADLPLPYRGNQPPQDFDRDVIAPVKARLAALREKYPNGLATAIDQALTPPPPEPAPEMSARLKELGRDPEVVRWMYQEGDVRSRLSAAQADNVFSEESRRLEDELRPLLPHRMGGKILEYDNLLIKHRKAYAEWIKRNSTTLDVITPHSDQAKEILAEVRDIGQQVRVGIDIDLAQRSVSPEREAARREAVRIDNKMWALKEQRNALSQTDPADAALAKQLDDLLGEWVIQQQILIDIPDLSLDPEFQGEILQREMSTWKRRRELARRTIAETVGTTLVTKQDWESRTPEGTAISDHIRDLNQAEKDAMTAGLRAYPASWAERFDQNHFTSSLATRGWHRAAERHIAISYSDGKELSDGSARIWGTILHEEGHGMQDAVPGLSGLEAMWWHDRLGELSPKTFHPEDSAMFPDEKPGNIKRPTAMRYSLKMYGNVYSKSNKHWEIFSTGVQEVLGDGKTDYTYWGVDRDLWDFTMGALLTLDGQPAAPTTATGV